MPKENKYEAWLRVIDRLNSEECAGIHKIYSVNLGFAYLTDRRGVRHKLEEGMSETRISEIIDLVKRVNQR
jgi:hypothetical protein